MLTQSEADTLISLPKIKRSDDRYDFPLPGEILTIPLISNPLPYLVPYNGQTIDCPHLHLYVEGFMDKWAIPVPNDKFPDTADLYGTLQDFFQYCNVVGRPKIDRGLTLNEF